jgi:hypothetical protein
MRMDAQPLSCPVCDVETNSNGSPFGSAWAVACHIAGSIYCGNKVHESWAAHQRPGINVNQTTPRLANELIEVVRLAIKSRRNWPEEVAAAIRSGQSPRSIPMSLGVSHENFVQFLYAAVRRQLLTRSEILFSIEEGIASVVERMITAGVRTSSELRQRLDEPFLRQMLNEEVAGFSTEHFRSFREAALLYFELREAPRADMYESLCRLETFMHAYIKTQLEREYGTDWWRKGIPEDVRKNCVLVREADLEPQGDPYQYTSVTHLKIIFDKQWAIFCKLLPKSFASNKPKFLSELDRLGAVRNKIMHPVRDYRPTKQDLEFVKDFAARMFDDSAQSA